MYAQQHLHRLQLTNMKKGSWTAQEDMLLKNCIEKYGEGKWHLVPLKAGLSRCRKSCRLRWLNYLRPNIKRGEFHQDEVDLIVRLHKLLGNKWSLIAGRIPGRTGNDVKNYWNTRFRSRSRKQKKALDEDKSLQDTTVTVIKPQPQNLSKTLNRYMGANPHIITEASSSLIISSKGDDNNTISSGLISLPSVLDDKMNDYLEDLFNDSEKEFHGKGEGLFGGSPVDGEAFNVGEQEHFQDRFWELKMDEVMWNFLDSDQL